MKIFKDLREKKTEQWWEFSLEVGMQSGDRTDFFVSSNSENSAVLKIMKWAKGRSSYELKRTKNGLGQKSIRTKDGRGELVFQMKHDSKPSKERGRIIL